MDLVASDDHAVGSAGELGSPRIVARGEHSGVVEGDLAVLDDHPYRPGAAVAGLRDDQPVPAVVVSVHVGHPRVRTLDGQPRVEVLFELGALDDAVAADDEGGHPARRARVAEVLEDPAQDRGPRFVGGTVGTVDPDEAPVLAVDDRARPKVERGELRPCLDRARQEIQPLREAEGGPPRLGLDTLLQVGTGTDLHPAAG